MLASPPRARRYVLDALLPKATSKCQTHKAKTEADKLHLLPKQLTIATSTKKNEPTYHIKATITPSPKQSSSKPQTLEFSRSFTEWFDGQGHFVVAPFQAMLANGIPLVGALDPKRVKVA